MIDHFYTLIYQYQLSIGSVLVCFGVALILTQVLDFRPFENKKTNEKG